MNNIEQLGEYLLENEIHYNFERDDLIILGETIYESENTNESESEELSSYSEEDDSLYGEEWLSVYDDEYDNIDSEKIDQSYYLGLPGYSKK